MKIKQPVIDLANISLDYEGFKALAKNNSLSDDEKIGFPDSYRKGFNEVIFLDITTKLTNLTKKNQTVLDIGPGCGELPKLLLKLCRDNQHKAVFCDSEEMLVSHPDERCLFKVPGMFPKTYNEVCEIAPQYDVILCYSVFHYITVDTNVWDFIDICLKLLKPGGQLLIGDIPNISKRKRFFSSEAGIKFHKEFMKTDLPPEVLFNEIELGKIDDSIILSVLMRSQSSGFDAYLVPQNINLPMSNRRDDILIVRP